MQSSSVRSRTNPLRADLLVAVEAIAHKKIFDRAVKAVRAGQGDIRGEPMAI